MKKILVVEDEETTRRTISKLVEDLGYVVIQASQGELALNILKDNKDFSLVVTDMQMPQMNGEQFIYSCREFDEYKYTPIIIVSGVVKLSEITKLVSLDNVRFIPKPIVKKDLFQYISEFLG
jgi:CheY-like chemotaxis protein